MLDPQKIFLSRVKQAYTLNEHEAQSLLDALSPDSTFPFDLWQKAYSSFWKYPAAENAKRYAVENPRFPEICPQPIQYFPTETYATWMVNLFTELAAIIHTEHMENGYDYIVECVYDSTENIFTKSKDDLFHTLYLSEKNIANYTRVKGKKDISLSKLYYAFMLKLFPDTVAVDKIAAIHYLSVLNEFPLVQEVKGITRSLVDSVIKAVSEKFPAAEPEAPQVEQPAAIQPDTPQSTFHIPAALWEEKPAPAVRDAMKEKYSEAIIAYVLVKWCGVTKTQTGRLLSEKQFEDEKSYRNLVDTLLEKAASLTIIKA